MPNISGVDLESPGLTTQTFLLIISIKITKTEENMNKEKIFKDGFSIITI